MSECEVITEPTAIALRMKSIKNKLVVLSGKGGVGKTTSVINLATVISSYGNKVLIIDLDSQGNATSGVGIDKRQIENSIYNVLHEHIKIGDAEHKTAIDNLFIIPSNINLTGAEVELVNVMGREYRLKKALQEVEEKFDYVIFDCPPSLGLLTINGLTAANSVLVPIQCEYYALEGLSQLMQTINLIKENLNDALKVEGILMTLADYRTNLTKEVISEVKQHFGELVYKTIIPRTIIKTINVNIIYFILFSLYIIVFLSLLSC